MKDDLYPIPKGEAQRVIREAERVANPSRDTLDDERALLDVIAKQYKKAQLTFPPLLAAYIEYCTEKEVPPDIATFASDSRNREVTPPAEKYETDAIITVIIISICAKTLPVDAPMRLEVLALSSTLSTVLEKINPDRAALLRSMLATNITGILDT